DECLQSVFLECYRHNQHRTLFPIPARNSLVSVACVVAGSRLSALFFPPHGALTVLPYAIVAAIGVVLGAFATQWSPVTRLEWALYDIALKRDTAGQPPAPGIVVVAIDEPSFTEIGMPWPWPRSLHARLVDRLAAAGAKTIAFDIVFDVPAQNPPDDEAFAEAGRRAWHAILPTCHAGLPVRGDSPTQ